MQFPIFCMKQVQVELLLKIQKSLCVKVKTMFGEIYDLNPNDFPKDGVILKAYLPATSFLGETIEEH